MPIFEFICKKCSHQFEVLFFANDDQASRNCPKCNSKTVEKLISAGSFRPNGIPKGTGGFDAPACKKAPGGG